MFVKTFPMIDNLCWLSVTSFIRFILILFRPRKFIPKTILERGNLEIVRTRSGVRQISTYTVTKFPPTLGEL